MKRILCILMALLVVFSLGAQSKTVKNPDTFIYASYGNIETLDPAKGYDDSSDAIIQNLYEGLVAFQGGATDKFVPVLAAAIPTVANGGISKDGLTYTFTIRKGVKFHSGNTLTAEGVRYSFLRNMITDPDGGPMWMFYMPIFGEQSSRDGDGNLILDFAALSKAITVSGDKVIFKLVKPFPPFLSILAGTWGAIVDKDFCIKNGDWDGKEATWKQFNMPATGKEKLYNIESGTGPYKLVRWQVGTEVVMERFAGYWGKKPAMAKAIYKFVEEWSTRKLMLLQGDADSVTVDPMYFEEMDKEPGLKVFKNLKELGVRGIGFNQAISATDNPYIYSGKLDGNGVPPDFFADKNVRLAFISCWNQKEYIQDILSGYGADVVTPIVDGLPFYNPNLLERRPEYNMRKAADFMKRAWGGQVWAKGFQVDLLYNSGNEVREAAMKMLAENMMMLNPKFKLNVRAVEWATYVDLQRNRALSSFNIGWGADYPDPDNFVNPYMYSQGLYGGRCSYNNPEADKLIEDAAVEVDPAKRKAMYYRLQEIWLEDAVGIMQHQPIGNRYFKDWVKGYIHHPMENRFRYWEFSKGY
jgi:peptide/nickel transport system substrate-binding protein